MVFLWEERGSVLNKATCSRASSRGHEDAGVFRV